MKKLLLKCVFIALVLTSCSKKESDFVGVYNFYFMDNYLVKDTTEVVTNFFTREYLKLSINKMTPLKIDIFKSGEEVKGTISLFSYQKYKALNLINKQEEHKTDLENLHLIKDTLYCDVKGFFYSKSLKIAKSNSNTFMIITENSDKIMDKEKCNKSVTINDNFIIYKAIEASQAEEIKNNSNLCEIDNKVDFYLSKGYKKEKSEHLRRILSINPDVEQK